MILDIEHKKIRLSSHTIMRKALYHLSNIQSSSFRTGTSVAKKIEGLAISIKTGTEDQLSLEILDNIISLD